jgi:hypothetical protein
MNAGGSVAEWQHVLTAMRDNAIAAMQITGGDIQLTTTSNDQNLWMTFGLVT